MNQRRLVPALVAALVLGACGGGDQAADDDGGDSGRDAEVPAEVPPAQPADEPSDTPAFTPRVGEAQVILDGQTYRFSTAVGTKADWSVALAGMCSPGIHDEFWIEAGGIDANGAHLAHESWISANFPTEHGDSAESDSSFRMMTDVGLYSIDVDDPGTWSIEVDDEYLGTTTGFVNLVDSYTKEPTGTATFEMTC